MKSDVMKKEMELVNILTKSDIKTILIFIAVNTLTMSKDDEKQIEFINHTINFVEYIKKRGKEKW